MAEFPEDDFPDDAVFRLSEAACMQVVLQDYDIKVGIKLAEKIMEDFMDLLVRQGYIGRNDNG